MAWTTLGRVFLVMEYTDFLARESSFRLSGERESIAHWTGWSCSNVCSIVSSERAHAMLAATSSTTARIHGTLASGGGRR